MRKIFSLMMCAFICSILLSACQVKHQTASMVKGQRRFAKYIEPPKESNTGQVDLSEGPRLKYDANFGPQTPNFEIKIVNPY